MVALVTASKLPSKMVTVYYVKDILRESVRMSKLFSSEQMKPQYIEFRVIIYLVR